MNKINRIQPKKIGIIRALWLGDLLCAIPAIRSLKALLPQSSITLIGLPWAKAFTERFSKYFDGFMEFPGFPGIPEKAFYYQNLMGFLPKVHAENFDLIIQLQGNGSIINSAAAMMGAKHLAGYYVPGAYCPNPDLFMPYPEAGSEIKKHLKLAQFLGFESAEESLEFPIFPSEERAFQQLCTTYKLQKGHFICVHAGARDVKRCWGAKKFASIADRLATKGYQIVLTGTEAERETVKQVEELMQANPVNLTGKTNLGILAALIREAKLLLSNDTGVAHIAAAVKTPSIIIFLTSDPKRWASINKKLHRIILPDQADNLDFVLTYAAQTLISQMIPGEIKKNDMRGVNQSEKA